MSSDNDGGRRQQQQRQLTTHTHTQTRRGIGTEEKKQTKPNSMVVTTTYRTCIENVSAQ